MNAPRRVAPQASSRRGWCPSLARPMPTGDGLLARIHPPGGVLTADQVRAIAEAARRRGNGLVDVTARGNLQLRGVTEATRGALALDLERVGLGDARQDGGPQRLTLTDTLAGLDTDDLIDAAALAQAIEREGLAIPGLPAKTLVAIEGGGRFGLAGSEADVILRASREGYVWIALGGDAGPSWLAEISSTGAAQRVVSALRAFVATGRRRMRDLSDDQRVAVAAAAGMPHTHEPHPPVATPMLPPGLFAASAGFLSHGERVGVRGVPHPESARPSPCPFPIRRGDPRPSDERDATPSMVDRSGSFALAVEAPFGRCSAQVLDKIADLSRALNDEEIRVTPTRGFLLIAPDETAARAAQAALAAAGFVVAADDPRRAVAACPGAPACASGSTPTLADAARLAEAFRPFAERGLRAHVSGCAKGCANPGATDLTFVGADGRYGIVLHGAPDTLPAMRMTFEAALDRVRRADPTRPLDQAFRTNP